MKDLSIIVPIYNVEKYLKQAIESLLDYKINYEIILVDDGSTDSSSIICDLYAHYPMVKVIHKPNGGLPSARKAGFKVATGRYIGFLDGDDWVDREYFVRMVKYAIQKDADVVCSSFVFSYENEERPIHSDIKDGLYIGRALYELRKKMIYVPPYYTYGVVPSLCTKIIRKEYLEEYLCKEPNNITLAEDAACSFPVLFNCKRVLMFNRNNGYHYRQISNSMTRSYDPQKYKKILNVMEYFERVMNCQDSVYSGQIYKFFSFLIKDEIRNESVSGNKACEIKRVLDVFRNRRIVDKTLRHITGVPFKYGALFFLFRLRMYSLLIGMMKIYNKGA